MLFLLVFMIYAAWAGYLSLTIDRPDQLVRLTDAMQMELHAGFIVLALLSIGALSWRQIYRSEMGGAHAMRTVSWTAIVLFALLGLLVYVGRMLLHGIDHTGHRALW